MATNFVKSLFLTTPGKKFIIAVGGLIFYLYVVLHLLGNLTLLTGDPELYNVYSHKLISLGPILIIIELILLAAFLFHGIVATIEKLKNHSARSVSYATYKSAGEPSRKTFSSTTMIYTGIVIFIFTVIHVITFKYGPGIEAGYVFMANGQKIRDLHRLVVDVFQKEEYVIGYVVSLILLGFHLRHAFWSAFQSLGAMNSSWTPVIYGLGTILAVLMATGYVIIPIWIYLMY